MSALVSAMALHSKMPKPPAGFEACRVGSGPQVTHLVLCDSKGNGGRPTMCRLTRFDTKDRETGKVLLRADLPGWSMGGGVSGPSVEHIECPECYARIAEVTR